MKTDTSCALSLRCVFNTCSGYLFGSHSEVAWKSIINWCFCGFWTRSNLPFFAITLIMLSSVPILFKGKRILSFMGHSCSLTAKLCINTCYFKHLKIIMVYFLTVRSSERCIFVLPTSTNRMSRISMKYSLCFHGWKAHGQWHFNWCQFFFFKRLEMKSKWTNSDCWHQSPNLIIASTLMIILG